MIIFSEDPKGNSAIVVPRYALIDLAKAMLKGANALSSRTSVDEREEYLTRRATQFLLTFADDILNGITTPEPELSELIQSLFPKKPQSIDDKPIEDKRCMDCINGDCDDDHK